MPFFSRNPRARAPIPRGLGARAYKEDISGSAKNGVRKRNYFTDCWCWNMAILLVNWQASNGSGGHTRRHLRPPHSSCQNLIPQWLWYHMGRYVWRQAKTLSHGRPWSSVAVNRPVTQPRASANVLTTGANAPVVSKNAPVVIGFCRTSTKGL